MISPRETPRRVRRSHNIFFSLKSAKSQLGFFKRGSKMSHQPQDAHPQPMARHIELWLISRLIPYARNPRTHSETQVDQIAASIAEFGFNNPILVDTKAGIIAGHGRLLAARKLQLQEVPVIVLDHLSEAQKRAYIITDNQLALNAGWDEAILRSELAALQAEDFNIDLIGFEDEELARLLAAQDAAEGLTDEDAVPEIQATPI
jgi:ParB-like chromosome segregation protein Spo0J